MGALLVKDMQRENCYDCGVEPGKKHKNGCGLERCTECEGQRLSCRCTDYGDYQKETWSGIPWERARLVAEENDLFSIWDKEKGWIDSTKDNPEAVHDINAAVVLMATKRG